MALTVPPDGYTGPPMAYHVADRIIGANWWPTDATQIASAERSAALAANAVTEHFKRKVKWEPFVSSGTPETRYFNQIDDMGRIMLGEGLLSLTSVTVLGRSYTVNETVFAEPANAAAKNLPYSHLQLWPSNYGYEENNYFARFRAMKPRSIVVIGTWGRVATWPADAFEAIVGRAAGITLASVNQESELASISEDGFSEAYDLVGPVDQKTALLNWGKYFDDVAKTYAKPRPGAQSVSTGAFTQQRNREYLPLP